MVSTMVHLDRLSRLLRAAGGDSGIVSMVS